MISWLTVGVSFMGMLISVLTASLAFVWRQGKREGAIDGKLKHLDECVDGARKEIKAGRDETNDGLRAIQLQVNDLVKALTKVQVNAARADGVITGTFQMPPPRNP